MSTAETMCALIFEGPHRLSLRAVPRPAPGPGEVLVKVRTAAICGTDVKIVAGRKTRDVRIGHPIGHECAGTVAQAGEGTQGFAVGDRVVVHPVVSCGECEYCRADRENLCDTRITLGYHTDGAFAEYMLIPAHAVRRGNLFRLPPEVPLEVATVVEPMGCCINGQREIGLRPAGPRRGKVVVFGAGPIGLLHLMLARGGSDVTVVEPHAHRRALAARLGAAETLPPEEFAAQGAFDAAILAVGVTELIGTALQAVRREGAVSLFAGFPAGSTAAIDPNLIHYRQIRVAGASESRRRDFAEALALAASGEIDLAPLISRRYPIESYEEAFGAAADGSAVKVAFDFPP